MQVTQLGAAASGGFSVTIGVDSDVPSPGLLHVVTALSVVGQTVEADFYITSCHDSVGGGWIINSSVYPQIGLIAQQMFHGLGGTVPPYDNTWDEIIGGSVIRQGNLSAGDTVTVEWDYTRIPSQFVDGNVEVAAVIVHMANADLATVPQGGTGFNFYGNGDAYPDNHATNPSGRELSWINENIALEPDRDAMLLAFSAALQGGTFDSFVPTTGYRVGGVNGSQSSLAVHARDLVEQGDVVDPGGIWGANARALIGNYQYHDFIVGPGGPAGLYHMESQPAILIP